MTAVLDWFRRPEAAGAVEDGEPRLPRGLIVLLALAVFASRVLASRAFPIYDDAFITYRYAQNLASGLGMVFNPGAAWEPILGTTTPGYTVILAGLSALGLPMIGASLTLNFACDALSAVLLVQLLDRRAVSSLVAVLAFAAIPEIARISAGGMEPPVVVCCTLAAVHAFQRGRMSLAGTFAALSCTLRPECVLLVATLAVVALLQKRSLVRFLIPIVVVGAVSAGLLQWVYGSPISHSVTAKAALHGGEQKPGFSRVPDILAQAFGPSLPMRLLAPLVALGAWTMLARRSRFVPFGVFAAAVVAAYLVAQPKTWGWYFYAPMAAWVTWLGLGCESLVRWVGFRRLPAWTRERPAALAALTGTGCALVVGVVSLFPLWRPDLVTPRVYAKFESWAREARLAERKITISASDIGAIGWYTGATIYDSEGLVWPEALQLPRTELRDPGRPALALEAVPRRAPGTRGEVPPDPPFQREQPDRDRGARARRLEAAGLVGAGLPRLRAHRRARGVGSAAACILLRWSRAEPTSSRCGPCASSTVSVSRSSASRASS
jgi:arabinofuranosyltransferase